MIDALFGSKTRVKLLHLFMNNPGKAFYVREITRLIDEQINSVRRELANMLSVGVITSNNTDNKLYYEVNQRYEFYTPFREIFAGVKGVKKVGGGKTTTVKAGGRDTWKYALRDLPGVRIAIVAGVLVEGSASKVDMLIAGTTSKVKITDLITEVEAVIGREITYATMTYDEFYYRVSVRDKFISDVLANKHEVLVDNDNIVG
jgi:hypothetical protein